MNETLFEYKGGVYPTYLRDGNAAQYIAPIARQFCKGHGVDVGAGKWPLEGARAVDSGYRIDRGERYDALELPLNPEDGARGAWDFVFSSHCLEHLSNPVAALEQWKKCLRPGGVVFLYLPHPSQRYWQPANCRKHLHLFWPDDVAQMLRDLGFVDVIHSERDLAWSFAVVGFKPADPTE